MQLFVLKFPDSRGPAPWERVLCLFFACCSEQRTQPRCGGAGGNTKERGQLLLSPSLPDKRFRLSPDRPRKDRGCLCAGCGALRVERSVCGADDQAAAVGPDHGGLRKAADGTAIGKSAQIGGGGNVPALIAGVTVQNCRKLLPGHGVVGAKAAVFIAADDPARCRPGNRLFAGCRRRHCRIGLWSLPRRCCRNRDCSCCRR